MKRLFIIATACLLSYTIQSQTVITGRSPDTQLKAGNPANIGSHQYYPELEVKIDQFLDSNRDQAIDAFEQDTLSFKIQNLGTGSARNVEANITLKGGDIPGLTYTRRVRLGTIIPNQTKKATITIKATNELVNDSVTFRIYVKEDRVDAIPHEITIVTRAFRPPQIVIGGQFATEKGGKIARKDKVTLITSIQNIGIGSAEDVTVSFSFLTKNINTPDNNKVNLDTLKPGESRELMFQFFTNWNYESDTIPIHVKISEQHEEYGVDTVFRAMINQEVLTVESTIITPKKQPEIPLIIPVPLTSDVNISIPTSSVTNDMTFALIIANEVYRKEENVEFATYDGYIFKQYCEKTLGIPGKNIHITYNATYGTLISDLNWISGVINAYKGKAKVIFYYSGHGMPDPASGTAYILPVDGTSTDFKAAISLEEIYKKLTNEPAQKVTVFLDACFSGSSRSDNMLALARSVAYAPDDEILSGNLVVFSASTGKQTAHPYKEKQHGMFTYFLLKKMQETSGKVTYKDLETYISEKVTQRSSIINEMQEPQVSWSPDVEGKWEKWRLVE